MPSEDDFQNIPYISDLDGGPIDYHANVTVVCSLREKGHLRNWDSGTGTCGTGTALLGQFL